MESVDWMKQNSHSLAYRHLFAGLVEWSAASIERGSNEISEMRNAAVLRFLLDPEMQLSHG